MAASVVDKKYLGRFASKFQVDHPLLAKSLFQILGIFTLLSQKLKIARHLRRFDITQNAASLDLFTRIIWYAREGLKILEEYIIPMVANFGEVKVLAYKLRASLYHAYVLYQNNPTICLKTGQKMSLQAVKESSTLSTGKDKSAEDRPNDELSPSDSILHALLLEEGDHKMDSKTKFQSPTDVRLINLIPAVDYRNIARHYFQEAVVLAKTHLYGSHPLRLSLMVEYITYLYDCLHECESSRKLAKRSISEVYRAQEGIDNEMFHDTLYFIRLLGFLKNRK
ncbi:putative 14-3-3 protein [Golovinomyces cichoracearum]|uniref:Putative 14-3-3 protein n=1 Tax=Golovinomyces cichoracearum TaxID=62708 RepID=A0A420J0A2_9PEZI|nr:putative 14-3-3 protein [Golovinomyces cichoracearum]